MGRLTEYIDMVNNGIPTEKEGIVYLELNKDTRDAIRRHRLKIRKQGQKGLV